MLIKPRNSLVEGLLLCELDTLVFGVSTHCETVANTRIQVDLERKAGLNEDLLGLVAVFDGEDGVVLRSGDGERSGDGSELVFLDEGWVGNITDVDAALVVTNDVLLRC